MAIPCASDMLTWHFTCFYGPSACLSHIPFIEEKRHDDDDTFDLAFDSTRPDILDIRLQCQY